MSTSDKESDIPTIDVRKIFSSKNPTLARLLPGFVYAYIKRIIHQDEINNILKKHGTKMGMDFVHAAINEFNIKFNIINEEHIPAEGQFILASNHPLGGFDGLILLKVLSKHFKSMKFLVNDLLLNLKNFESFFVPINKHGGQARAAAQLIEDTYSSEAQVLTFPAGLVSRRNKGVIADLEWKKSFIVKSIEYKRDIIPVFISGRNSNFFYNLSKLRKFFGVKANIEMFYLADETFKHRNKTITLVFGKSIPYQTFTKDKTPSQWAAEIRKYVYILYKNPNAEFKASI